MEYYGNTLCITHTELTAGILSNANLKQLRSRGKVHQVRRGCNGTPALFAVESLPLKYRTEVYRRYPDLKEAAESKPFVEQIEADGSAMQFYADYVLADGRHLSNEKQTEYANNCAIMNAFGQCIEKANSHRIRQSKPKLKLGEFWKKAAAALPRISDAWPNSLPQNARRLHMKYNEYRKQGAVVFISKKYQNSNAAKVDDAQKEAVLTELIAHHNNLDNVMIAEYYNKVAEMQGWEQITASTVRVWKEQLDLVTSAGRRGATNFRNERSMQVKRRRPSAAFLMWTLDGWDCELLYQTVKEDANGRHLTTYSNRLCLEVVLDPCCDYPIGYAIGTHETPELITEALRDAARHSAELAGEMLRANQLQCDHYGIKAMTPLYLAMSDKLTPARVKNAKAKVVEPYFGYLNKTYCKRCNNWSGYGVTTDPKRQPNSEALNMLRHTFPDEEGVRAQIHAMMAAERTKKHEKMMQMLGKLPAERRLKLSKESYLLYFGDTTGQTNALCGGGLRPTLLGEKREYDTFDLTFRKHAGERWTVLYDPEDLTEVLAVNQDGTLRYMLQEKYVQPMALADRTEGDVKELQKVQEFNERLEAHVTDKLSEAYQLTEELIKDNPRVGNILNRFCLCDSRGQHKLPREQKRLGIEAEAVATSEQAEEPSTVKTESGHSREEIEDYSIF
jgi:hypothetical protein